MNLCMNGVKVGLQTARQVADQSTDGTVRLDERAGLRGVVNA